MEAVAIPEDVETTDAREAVFAVLWDLFTEMLKDDELIKELNKNNN